MIIDCGYGAKLKRPKWKEDAVLRIRSKFGPKMQGVFNAYYRKNRADGFQETEEEYAPCFCEDYENDTYGWTGMTAVIADVINENGFNGEPVFRANSYYDMAEEVCCIYVSADIPENDRERDRMLTKEHIRRILAEYLSTLLESSVEFDYINITE